MRHPWFVALMGLLLLSVGLVAARGTAAILALANPQFLITPTALEYGNVAIGGSTTQSVNVTNVTGAPIVMSGLGGSAPAPFSASQNCQGHTLNPGQSCQMFYEFAPTSLGGSSGTSVGSWNGQAFSVNLHGTGVEGLLISPVGLDFGAIVVGSSAPTQMANVTNVSNAPVVMSGLGGAAPSPFSASQSCQGHTLNPGQSCQMFFDFAPTSVGDFPATANGSWNGQPFSISLHGIGVQAPTATPTSTPTVTATPSSTRVPTSTATLTPTAGPRSSPTPSRS